MTIPPMDIARAASPEGFLALDAAARNGPPDEAEKIRELSQQFEALLLRQILKETRRPAVSSGVFETSTSADIYNDMINFHLADCISRSGDFGLAANLERELTRQNHGAPGLATEDPSEP